MPKLTLRQAAERLGTTRQNVYKLAKRRGMLKRQESPLASNGWAWVLSLKDVEKLEKERSK